MQTDQNMKRAYLHVLPTPLSTIVQSPIASTVAASVLCLISYMNGLNGDLVHDDIFAIRDNLDLRPSTPLTNLLVNDFWGKTMSDPTSHKSYRPLTVLTFRLNYQLHELDTWGYHAVNIGLHVLATGLFGCLCRRVVFGNWRGDVVFLATCLFATHPVHTEAVTGIVGRADVLACVFFLISFLFYWSSVTSVSRSLGIRVAMFIGCLISGTAAMLSKEHGATVFGVCMAYDILIVNRHKINQFLSNRTLTSDLRPLIFRSVLLVTIAVTLLLVRVSLLHGHLPHFGAEDNPASFAESFLTKVLTYSYLFYFNARLLIFPSVLCYDYQMGSIPLVESLMDYRNIHTIFFYFVVFCLTWRSFYDNGSKYSNSVTLIGLMLIVVPFLPASNLLIRVGFVVAERILYISSMGYCVLIALGIATLARRFKSCRPIVFIIFLALVGVFSLRTVTRNPVWATRESLFRSGLETIPHNAKIHFNFANFLKDTGRSEEAVGHYRTALSLWPEHAVSHNNLGTLLLNISEAEVHFREAIKYNPQHYKALYNLGTNLQIQDRVDEAEQALRRSLAINPTYPDTLMGLATLLADRGMVDEGWPYMEEAASIAPNNADILNNLGAYLLRLRKVEEALAAYHKALHIDPRHALVMSSVARVYRSQGENNKAEEWFKRSLSIKKDVTTFHHLGALYHNTGSLEKAAVTFEEALRLQPERVETVCSYGQTLLLLNRYDDVVAMANKALQVHPSTPCVHTILASVYLQLKRLNKALHHSSIAVKLNNGTAKAEALHVHGGILKDLGQLDLAEQAYRQAVELNPDNPSSRMNLGALLHLRKAYKEAREQYKTSLRLDPDNQLVKDNLSKLNRLEKQNKRKL